jgi:hypothetical protein
MPGFSALRDMALRETLPHEVAQSLLTSVGTEFVTADTRVAARLRPLRPIWLVPANDGDLCLVRLTYATSLGARSAALPPSLTRTCLSDAEAKLGRLVETQTPGSSTRGERQTAVIGVVPDGVRTVTLVSWRGSRETVSVRDNAYEGSLVDPREAQFVLYRNARALRRRIDLAAGPQTLNHPTRRTEFGS